MFDLVDQKRMVYITFAVILFISALFAPVAIFYPIKAMFITPEAIAINTSPASLVTGGVGLFLLAAGLIVLANVEKRLMKYGTASLLFIAGAIGISFSLTDYFYVTPEKFVINAPLTFTSEEYEWNEFDKVEENIIKEDGMTKVDSLTFYMENGEIINMSAGSLAAMSSSIINNIQASGGTHERIAEE